VKTFAAALSEISGSMDELAEGSRGILGATEKISEVTKHIIKGSEEMEQGTREIELAMKNSEEISGGVVNGISEIDKGAKEILQSIVEINRLTVESRERMEELHTAVDSFKTS
jgi:methyl-accepting chemotaxis protein